MRDPFSSLSKSRNGRKDFSAFEKENLLLTNISTVFLFMIPNSVL